MSNHTHSKTRRKCGTSFIVGVVPNANSSMTLHFEGSHGSTNIVQAATDLAAAARQNVSTNITDGPAFGS